MEKFLCNLSQCLKNFLTPCVRCVMQICQYFSAFSFMKLFLCTHNFFLSATAGVSLWKLLFLIILCVSLLSVKESVKNWLVIKKPKHFEVKKNIFLFNKLEKIDIESCRKIRNQKACRGERTERILNRSENSSWTENLESRMNNGWIIKGIFVMYWK